MPTHNCTTLKLFICLGRQCKWLLLCVPIWQQGGKETNCWILQNLVFLVLIYVLRTYWVKCSFTPHASFTGDSRLLLKILFIAKGRCLWCIMKKNVVRNGAGQKGIRPCDSVGKSMSESFTGEFGEKCPFQEPSLIVLVSITELRGRVKMGRRPHQNAHSSRAGHRTSHQSGFLSKDQP